MKLFESFWRKKNRDFLEKRLKEISDSREPLPGYLLYPGDPIAQKMFEPHMKIVSDDRCGYQFKLYTEIADITPEIKGQMPAMEINETHVFWKRDSAAWCSVSTMKGATVKTSNLRNWVEASDQMAMLFGGMIPFLNLPSQRETGEYRRVSMYYLGENASYNKLHGFEETHVYCHVFYLGDQLYKKFILCAKKDAVSWKVECTIPSAAEALSPTDTVPPGLVFGSFFPC